MSSSTWPLSYWIRGDPFHKYWIVDISSDADVRTLLKLIIHESHTLSQHEQSSIDIYRAPDNPPIPAKKSRMRDSLGNLSISMLGASLDFTDRLDEIFEVPPSTSYLNFIIDIPSLDVTCWLRGTDISESFVVSSSKQDKANHLTRAIKQANSGLKDVSEAKLKLCKTSATGEELAEILDKKLEGQILDKNRRLEELFNDVPFSEDPRVVVDWVDEKASKPPPSVSQFVEDDDPIARKRREYLAGVPRKAPSSLGKVSVFGQRQGVEHQAIPCCRPRDCEDLIPPALLHPVFGQFLDDCQTMELDADDNNLAYELAVKMSDIKASEEDRKKTFNGILKNFGINLQALEIPGTKYTMDGCLFVNDHRTTIMEMKNEAGGSGDAYFQVVAYYLESTREHAPKYPGSTLPCLLLAVSGPSITFNAAAWNTRPGVQPLSTPVTCAFHSNDKRNLVTLARYMGAFRKAVGTLGEYYGKLRKPSPYQSPSLLSKTPPQSGTLTRSRPSSQSKSRLSPKVSSGSNMPPQSQTTRPEQHFPHPTSYERVRGNETETVEFKYDGGVAEDKLIFFGTELHSRERICIKFCDTYSAQAHAYMAKLGHAPTLRAVNHIPGGWIMAVFDALLEFETIADRRQPLSASVFDSISNVLRQFHDARFVHGDIRDVNIMVSKTDETKFMFVDFDWAGKQQVVRYPPCVNTKDIKRPENKLDGKLILEEHDVFMLDQMIQDNLREGSVV